MRWALSSASKSLKRIARPSAGRGAPVRRLGAAEGDLDPVPRPLAGGPELERGPGAVTLPDAADRLQDRPAVLQVRAGDVGDEQRGALE
jgi:hypothetical protein